MKTKFAISVTFIILVFIFILFYGLWEKNTQQPPMLAIANTIPITINTKGAYETNDHWLQYQVTGPFFDNATSVPLQLNAFCCDNYNPTGTAEEQSVYPEVVEIKHNDMLLDQFSHIVSHVSGFCIANATQQLGILLTQGGDAPAGIDQFRYLLLYNPNSQHFDSNLIDPINQWEAEYEESPDPEQSRQDKLYQQQQPKLVSCGINETLLPEKNGSFTPCRCDTRLLAQINQIEDLLFSMDDSHDLIASTYKSLYYFDNGEPLAYATVPQQVIKGINEYQRASTINSLIIDHINTGKMEMMVLTYWKPIYKTHSRILVRPSNASHWKLIYSAHPNSQGFSPPVFSKIVNEQQIELLICLEGCDWQYGNSSARVLVTNNQDDFFLQVASEWDITDYHAQVSNMLKRMNQKNRIMFHRQ